MRAENGGTVSRFNFAYEQANRTKATLEAANGRIMDVDIATESTKLAKYNILVQASASMLAQANTTPNAALMLLGVRFNILINKHCVRSNRMFGEI